MKKLFFLVMVVVILFSNQISAQIMGYASGCGTFVQGIECSWFIYDTGLPFGNEVDLLLDEGLQFPLRTDQFYIEGVIKYNSTPCPMHMNIYYIEVSNIEACGADSCANQKPGDFNSDGVFSIADITFITPYLHRTGTAPNPIANSDANGDCIFNVGDTKHVLDFLFNSGPSPVDCTCLEPIYLNPCCWQSRGNVDYDPADIIDISDLVTFVESMFYNPLSYFICIEEANIDGDAGGIIDISDLVYLVDFMFSNGPEPQPCP